MSQYTIECPGPRPTSLYASNDIYVEVDAEDEIAIAKLEALIRYGVVVRPSTKEEADHVWALEVELDFDEDDVARHWPEEEGEIILQIKDW
jgi:hypothetical protein